MTATMTAARRAAPALESALVWIDTRDALVLTADGDIAITHLTSGVPAHHASTGHVRHDPAMRHGGGGSPQEAGEAERHEHLARFLQNVASTIPNVASVTVMGPGVVAEQLMRHLVEGDVRHGRLRTITHERSGRLTRGELIAHFRELRGEPVRRRTVGAFRWDVSPRGHLAHAHRLPGHVVQKPPERELRGERG